MCHSERSEESGVGPRPAHPGNPHGYPDYTYPMIWVLQDNQLWDAADWAAHVGVQKSWFVWFFCNAGAGNSVAVYTVPAGKQLYVVHDIMGATQIGYAYLNYSAPSVILINAYVAAYASLPGYFKPPFVVPPEKTLYAAFWNEAAVNATVRHNILAFEVDV